MVLIISTENMESTSAEVMDWLDYQQADYRRINGEDLQSAAMAYSPNDEQSFWMVNGERIDLENIKTVWLRRLGNSILPKINDPIEPELHDVLRNHARKEIRAMKYGALFQLADKRWLSDPSQLTINKLFALKKAKEAGFIIPETMVTTDKKTLLQFIKNQDRAIIKSLDATFSHFDGKHWIVQYTNEIKDTFAQELPETFFPTLVQSYIEKEYELRIFYLDKKCYSMAIFSQRNQQTSVDFRQYDWATPNRTVPFTLPEAIAEKVHAFMQLVNLETGSLDLIKTPEGDYVFLEVNPVGQFGMVSKPCNYFLEKKVAGWLSEL